MRDQPQKHNIVEYEDIMNQHGIGFSNFGEVLISRQTLLVQLVSCLIVSLLCWIYANQQHESIWENLPYTRYHDRFYIN